MPVLIGTCGWQYRHWRGLLYPPGLPQRAWLARYAERFAALEVDSSFYRLPTREAVARWADTLPPDMVVTAKASRYLTHVRRLRDPVEPVDRLLDRLAPLGGRLGAVLLQLPPTMPRDDRLLAGALGAFAGRVRVAVEPRHGTWFAPEVRDLLAERGAALCLADRGGPVAPLWRTAGWGYLRLHGGGGDPPGCYREDELDAWAVRLAGLYGPDAEVLVLLNNDGWGCALRDAVGVAEAARRAGLAPTRVPGPEDVAGM